jgi:hypothetical protein
MPVVCPVGSACAGKTDSTTSTTTATGTGTFYATSAQPVSSTVTATNTSTVTATNYSLVQVLNGGVTAARTLSSADVTGALGYTPGTGNGNLSGNGVSGSNALVDVSNGLVTATHAATSTFPTSSAGWLHDNGSGTRAWTTPTYTDVGADQSGAAATAQSNAQSFATSAVNSAVNSLGYTNYVAYFNALHQVAPAWPMGTTPVAQVMFPLTDSLGNLAAGFLKGAIAGTATHVPVFSSTAGALTDGFVASATPGAGYLGVADSSGTLDSYTTHGTKFFIGPGSVQSPASTNVALINKGGSDGVGCPSNRICNLIISGDATVSASSAVTCDLTIAVDYGQVSITQQWIPYGTSAAAMSVHAAAIGVAAGAHTVQLYLTAVSGTCVTQASAASLTIQVVAY